jgi:predicted RNase H-like nuclease (RuvC/YqgF family)
MEDKSGDQSATTQLHHESMPSESAHEQIKATALGPIAGHHWDAYEASMPHVKFNKHERILGKAGFLLVKKDVMNEGLTTHSINHDAISADMTATTMRFDKKQEDMRKALVRADEKIRDAKVQESKTTTEHEDTIRKLQETINEKEKRILELEESNKVSKKGDSESSPHPEETLAEWREVALKAVGNCKEYKAIIHLAHEGIAKIEKKILEGAAQSPKKKDNITEEQKEEAKEVASAKATVKVQEKKIRQLNRVANDLNSLNHDLKAEISRRDTEIRRLKLRERELEDEMAERDAAFDRREHEILYGRVARRQPAFKAETFDADIERVN